MKKTWFADIILPFAVRGRFTYMIPENLTINVKPGVRVMVPFGNKNLYSGIVCKVHSNKPDTNKVKSICAAKGKY
jgi:primosomal protein N' (replication factor Y)